MTATSGLCHTIYPPKRESPRWTVKHPVLRTFIAKMCLFAKEMAGQSGVPNARIGNPIVPTIAAKLTAV